MITMKKIFLDGGSSPVSDTYMGLPTEGRDDPSLVPDPAEAAVGSKEEEKAETTPDLVPDSEKPVDKTADAETDKAQKEDETSDDKKTDSDSKDEQITAQNQEQELLRYKNIQTRHQKVMKVIREKHPVTYNELAGRRRVIDEKYKPLPHHEQKELVAGVDYQPVEDEPDNKEYLTAAGQAKLQQNAVRAVMAEERQAQKQIEEATLDAQMKDSYKAEYDDVQAQITELAKQTMADEKTPLIPQEIWEQVRENIRPRMELPGEPTNTLHDVMREVRLLMLEKNLNQTRVAITAEETEKVRKVKTELSQPAHAGASTGAKKSDEMEDLERRRQEVSGQPLDSLPE